MIKIQNVRSAIKAKLDTMTGTGKCFAWDSNVFTQNVSGFPFVMFEPVELQSEFSDTANNYRDFIFNIVIVQEMNQISRADAMDIVLNCFETMIDAFDQDFTLGGVVNQIDATQGNFWEIDLGKWPCLYLSSNLNCRVLVPIK